MDLCVFEVSLIYRFQDSQGGHTEELCLEKEERKRKRKRRKEREHRGLWRFPSGVWGLL